MPNLQQADDFFTNHLLKEKYFEFSVSDRSAAVSTAVRDISAAMKLTEFPDVPGELISAAVYEQAIYLLLNPHITAGTTDASRQDVLSPRARALLAGNIQEPQELHLTLRRG